MQTRRFIIILILVPLLLIIGAGVYFLGPWRDEEKPPEEKVALKVLSEEQVVSPILSFDGQKVWYITKDGKMWRVNIETQEREEYLLPQTVQYVARVIWPKSGSDFILEQDLGQTQYSFFDSLNRAFIDFPQAIKSVHFLPDSERIVYIWRTSEGQYELKTADKSSQNFQKIAELRRPDYEIAASPVEDKVAIYGTDSLEPGYLMLVDLKTGEFKDVDQRSYFEGALFAPDGKKLLATKEGQLILYNLEDLTFVATNIFAQTSQVSWAQSGQSFFAGTVTGFVKYDVESGLQELIYRFGQTENLKPKNLLVHPQQNLLFFVDENTGKLYQLDF